MLELRCSYTVRFESGEFMNVSQSNENDRYSQPPTSDRLSVPAGMANRGIDSESRSLLESLGSQLGATVNFAGMVENVRDFKHHAFVILRDRSAVVQGVVSKDSGIKVPAVGIFVEGSGTVTPNSKAPAGYEIGITAMKAVSASKDLAPVPFDRPISSSLDYQLDNRAVVLRNKVVQAAFKVQARVGSVFRSTMEELGFLEIHTPKIVSGGTEGGAEVFKINYFDQPASLAQSPQLYKQISAGAFERVYEIGPVFRAETSFTSHHMTEFIGLDYEMTMIRDQHDVMDVQEKYIRNLVEKLREHESDQLALLGVNLPEIDVIPRISWNDADRLVDKHNTRAADVKWDKSVGIAVQKEFGVDFVFVYGYPEEEKPFYIMPSEKVGYTESFDLLFRGLEISSGGQRVHDFDQLVERMTERGLRLEDNPGYLQAYRSGMPPHGGAGVGLERLVQRLTGISNIRQVSLFPRDPARVLP